MESVSNIFQIFPILESDTMILRDLRIADRAAIFRIYSDDVVDYFNPYSACRTVRDAEAIIQDLREVFRRRSGVVWGITLRDKGTVIGTCGLREWVRTGIHAHRAELGFVMARTYWRQGYTSAAIEMVLRFGFEQMKLNRIEANMRIDNDAAAQLLVQKFGFVKEGRLRERCTWDNQFFDVDHFALLRRDWLARHNPHPTIAD